MANRNGLCVSCWDEKSTTVLLPCKHLCVCEECTGRLMVSAQPACPICRKSIHEIMKVFVT